MGGVTAATPARLNNGLSAASPASLRTMLPPSEKPANNNGELGVSARIISPAARTSAEQAAL